MPNGTLDHSNIEVAELIEDAVCEFAYVFAPMPIKGATGSAGSPIAIT